MTELAIPYAVQPAVAAVTVTTFDLVDVQENYGYTPENVDPDQPGMNRENYGRGQKNSVTAVILFPTTPPATRTLTAWEGEAYLAVRGTWTDETLRARIKEILEAESA